MNSTAGHTGAAGMFTLVVGSEGALSILEREAGSPAATDTQALKSHTNLY